MSRYYSVKWEKKASRRLCVQASKRKGEATAVGLRRGRFEPAAGRSLKRTEGALVGLQEILERASVKPSLPDFAVFRLDASTLELTAY
jgi:hypothetical protein